MGPVRQNPKSGKAQGKDGIPSELLKAFASRGKQELYEIRNDIYTVSQKSHYFVSL